MQMKKKKKKKEEEGEAEDEEEYRSRLTLGGESKNGAWNSSGSRKKEHDAEQPLRNAGASKL